MEKLWEYAVLASVAILVLCSFLGLSYRVMVYADLQVFLVLACCLVLYIAIKKQLPKERGPHPDRRGYYLVLAVVAALSFLSYFVDWYPSWIRIREYDAMYPYIIILHFNSRYLVALSFLAFLAWLRISAERERLAQLPSGKLVVMLLTNPFRPDPRVLKEALSLAKRGFHVRIYAWDRDLRYPEEEEVARGVLVKRIKLKCPKWNLPTFLALLPAFYALAFFEVLSDVRSSKFITHANDLDTLPLAVALKLATGNPVIYDMHDYYPGMLPAALSPLSHALHVVQAALAKLADGVMLASAAFAPYVPVSKRAEVVLNAPPKEKIAKKEKKTGERAKVNIFYYGNLTKICGTDFLVDCAKHVRNARFIVAGEGPYADVLLKLKSEGEPVDYLGWITPEEIAKVTLDSDLLFIPYDPKVFNNTLRSPIKLFEAMALATPVVVPDKTFMAKIVREERCGFVIPYGDVAALQEVVDNVLKNPRLLAELGANGAKACEERYNWEEMERRMLHLYSSAARSLLPQAR